MQKPEAFGDAPGSIRGKTNVVPFRPKSERKLRERIETARKQNEPDKRLGDETSVKLAARRT
jgi:hypothetical protein